MEIEQAKAITDERFAAAQSDPRKKSMVEIDSRFQRLFIDRNYSASTSTAEEEEEEEEEEDSASTRTRRLAVVELDWHHVRSVDIYRLLSLFLPQEEGQILSVAVYPSDEFGLERMEEEAVLFDQGNEELRQAYELNKLRYYYYAVVECDSIATADYLHQTFHGVEFEGSSNKLMDLRFIPDSMEFKHQPRDVATEATANYEGLDFQTQALQQCNIQLTWDGYRSKRSKTLKNILQSEQSANDISASDESETDEDDNGNDKFLALLKLGDGSDEDNARQEIAEETEASKAELELLLADDNLKGLNLKPKKGKEAAPDEEKIPTVDYSDPPFSHVFADSRFALHPIVPRFKRSAPYARQLIHSVQASEMHEDETYDSDGLAKRKLKDKLLCLVRSFGT